MLNIEPMFHMDDNYEWCWYITDGASDVLAMSTRSFFNYEEARRDYDSIVRRSHIRAVRRLGRNG